MKRALVAIVLFALVTFAYAQNDPLPSWNEGASKTAILDFVADVTDEASPDFVIPEERIATFDNDGTLWVEKPIDVESQFAIDRVEALAPQHPEWKTTPPFNRLLAGDMTAFPAGGEQSLVAMVAASHSGMTPEDFERTVMEWLATAKHPTTDRFYTALVYQPMLELFAYLRANDFKTFIVSGGGVEFVRALAQYSGYGVPPEQVIGSEGNLKFEMREGTPVLIKLPDVQFIDDQEGKPLGIAHHIGRRPIAAFGNSDGDLQMLQWTAAGSGKRLCLYVHHTDASREWAYDRHSSIGRLDQGLDVAKAKGWTVVSMKDDWKTIFPPQ
jgi:phosphoglycolate phosphatase-like HAD superfamily hydrolase